VNFQISSAYVVTHANLAEINTCIDV